MMNEFDIYADDPAYDEDTPNEGYFSWAACDSCNDTLGGQRYDIVAVSYTHLTLPTTPYV